MIKLRNNYFFKNGTYDYVIYEYNHDGTVDYLKIRLINKNNLKDEIKKQLRGGDAEGNKREAYLEFKDVYGVTDDLEVFYCSNGILSAIGASYLNSSLFDSTKVMYNKESPASKALAETMGIGESKDLTISDLRATTELTVSNESGAKDLNFLVDMPKITKLIIKNYKGSLNGIEYLEGLTYLYIDNTEGATEINYEGLRGATSLTELKFYMPTDTEVEKMCTEMGKADYSKLSTLYLYGFEEASNNQYITSLAVSSEKVKERSNLSNIESLNYLTEKTKQNVTTVFLNNNKLLSLNGLESFKNVNNLYVQNNKVDETVSLNLGESLKNMTNLNNLFIGYDNITNDDLKNISVNKNIKRLSIPGDVLVTELSVLKELTSLIGLQTKNNSNLILSEDSIIQKIAGLSEYYFDDKYSTALALANIGTEVSLGTDAKDSDIGILLGKEDSVLQNIKYFEIPKNKEISDSVLQNLLKKLTNLEILWADDSNLSSFNFIDKKNDKLQYISVFNTSIMNLENLRNCTNLRGININTQGLDLKNYSDIVNMICSHNTYRGATLKGGIFYCGGFNSTATILNTLNGNEIVNDKLTCFGSYGDPALTGAGTIDLTNTSLKELKTGLWNGLTIKLPAGFESCLSSLCEACKLDYSNISSAETYDCVAVRSVNFGNFIGYNTVKTNALDPSSIIGTNTKILSLGKYWNGSVKTATNNYELSKIIEKGSNIEDVTIFGGCGFSNISILSPLKLTTLEIQYSSLYKLKSDEAAFGNMATSLTTLKINNCSTFNDLDGLNKLSHITTLDLSNNSSLGNIQTITKPDGSKETKNTCQYIVESLSELKKVTLKDCGLNDFSYLTSHGFTETSNGSREFTKNLN